MDRGGDVRAPEDKSMPAYSRPKDGVLPHAYVAGIHVFLIPGSEIQDVDGRDKPGHDCMGWLDRIARLQGLSKPLIRQLL